MRTIMLITALLCAGCDNDSPTQPPARKVIAFTATWCQPCQRNKPKLAELERQGVTIEHIDVDANPALAKQYKIKSVPTYVLVEGDKEVERTQNVKRLFRLLKWLLR